MNVTHFNGKLATPLADPLKRPSAICITLATFTSSFPPLRHNPSHRWRPGTPQSRQTRFEYRIKDFGRGLHWIDRFDVNFGNDGVIQNHKQLFCQFLRTLTATGFSHRHLVDGENSFSTFYVVSPNVKNTWLTNISSLLQVFWCYGHLHRLYPKRTRFSLSKTVLIQSFNPPKLVSGPTIRYQPSFFRF